MRKLLGLVAVVVVLVVAVGAYYRVGWTRMVDACPTTHAGSDGVTYSWSWGRPVGFTCTYADGAARTSLWF